MAKAIVGVNPDVLYWARRTSGYTLDQAAHRCNKDVETVEDWESGKQAPTYCQLEELAKLYKRPVAVFFFPSPPEEPDPRESFRTIPREELEELHPDTRLAIREARGLQLALYELTDGLNPADKRILEDIHIAGPSRARSVAQRVRGYIGVTMEEQARWPSPRLALKEWRNRIQDCGVFVVKRAFKQNDISGFSLYDESLPLIYLNNKHPFTRQLFTLFHELPHLLLRENGITPRGTAYINELSRREARIEVFCNRVASEILVPQADFAQVSDRDWFDEDAVAEVASRYSVSREVVLRRAFDMGLVDQAYYHHMATRWSEEAMKVRGRGSKGGNWYRTQAAYLGSQLLQLGFRKMHEGKCSPDQLAEYLGVKTKRLPELEALAMEGA